MKHLSCSYVDLKPKPGKMEIVWSDGHTEIVYGREFREAFLAAGHKLEEVEQVAEYYDI